LLIRPVNQAMALDERSTLFEIIIDHGDAAALKEPRAMRVQETSFFTIEGQRLPHAASS
jgi:hypothetical protein